MATGNKNKPANGDLSASTGLPPEPPGLRRTLWWIFILTIAVYLIPSPLGPGHFIVTKSGAASWNDQARIATVESITERGTMAIDYSKWGWFTGDKVLLREHFYSTKPPMLSTVGAASYMVLRAGVKAVTGHEITYIRNEDIIYPWVTLTTVVLAFALLLVYFYRALHLVDLSKGTRWLLFWALAIGSLYPAYSSVLNNHTVAGAGIFIAFYYVVKYRLGGQVRWWEALFAGIAVGFAGVNDFTGALPFVAFLFILLAVHDIPRADFWPVTAHQRGFMAVSVVLMVAAVASLALGIGTRGVAILMITPLAIGLLIGAALAIRRYPTTFLYFLGVMIPVAAHLFLNSRITGNWMPTYIQSDVYIAVPPGYFGEVLSPEEAGALYWARWKYAGIALFGIRGVFLYTPAILLGLVAAFMIAFRKGLKLRLDAVLTILAVIAGWGWVLFFASPNFGGTSYGFRYAIAATPVLIFFSHYLLQVIDKTWMHPIYRNAVYWGAIVGIIAIPYPWGMFGNLPQTQCSIVGNLEYIAFNTMLTFSQL